MLQGGTPDPGPCNPMALTNPLVQRGSFPAAAWDPTYSQAAVPYWGGSNQWQARSLEVQHVPDLAGKLLAEQRSPRRLDNTYMGDSGANSAAVRVPQRVTQPYIAALSRCGAASIHMLAQVVCLVPHSLR